MIKLTVIGMLKDWKIHGHTSSTDGRVKRKHHHPSDHGSGSDHELWMYIVQLDSHKCRTAFDAAIKTQYLWCIRGPHNIITHCETTSGFDLFGKWGNAITKPLADTLEATFTDNWVSNCTVWWLFSVGFWPDSADLCCWIWSWSSYQPLQPYVRGDFHL